MKKPSLNTRHKIIVGAMILIIAAGVLVYRPDTTRGAAVVFDPQQFLVEFVIKPLVRKIANSLENKLVNKVNQLLGNINGKQPAFITNWRNNLLDSQARGNDVFRAVLADSGLCPYFKQNLLRSFGADRSAGAIAGSTVRNSRGHVVYQNKTDIPGLPSFQTQSRCTLGQDFDLETFKDDFNQGGGWATWNKLIQPQNNFYDIYNLAMEEQQKQIKTDEQAARDSSVAGRGFLSQQLGLGSSGVGPTGCTGSGVSAQGSSTPVCTDLNDDGSIDERDQGESQTACVLPGTSQPIASRCAFLGKVITPAEVLGQTAANTLDTKLKRIGGATYLTDIVLSLFAAVIDGTTSRLANFVGQNTYDRPPSAPPPFTGASQFNETPQEPGAQDPNFDERVDSINRGVQNSCQDTCLEREAASCNQISDPDEQQQCRNDAGTTCASQCSL